MNITQEFTDLISVIEAAGEEARAYFYSAVNPTTQKTDGSIVTAVDEAIEQTLRAHIAKRFPHDTVVGEEGDTTIGTSGFVWYIDPIDGTDNFVRKIPFFAVTAARLGPTAEDSFAIIHNPISQQTFASLMEAGTYEDKNLCTLTADSIGGKYFITVSANTRHNETLRQVRSALWGALYQRFGKAGSYHSALLELAYVAAGRLDGALFVGMSPWDTAAGLYLVKAAGGAISMFKSGQWNRVEQLPIQHLYGSTFEAPATVFVSHPDIHEEVLDFVDDPLRWVNA